MAYSSFFSSVAEPHHFNEAPAEALTLLYVYQANFFTQAEINERLCAVFAPDLNLIGIHRI
jgi:hypothetical protein